MLVHPTRQLAAKSGKLESIAFVSWAFLRVEVDAAASICFHHASLLHFPSHLCPPVLFRLCNGPPLPDAAVVILFCKVWYFNDIYTVKLLHLMDNVQ